MLSTCDVMADDEGVSRIAIVIRSKAKITREDGGQEKHAFLSQQAKRMREMEEEEEARSGLK